jgi:hypothetical protein
MPDRRFGLFVTDARLLSTLPAKATDWRDPSLVLDDPVFDRLSITNSGRVLQKCRKAITGLMEARASTIKCNCWSRTVARQNPSVHDR